MMTYDVAKMEEMIKSIEIVEMLIQTLSSGYGTNYLNSFQSLLPISLSC